MSEPFDRCCQTILHPKHSIAVGLYSSLAAIVLGATLVEDIIDVIIESFQPNRTTRPFFSKK